MAARFDVISVGSAFEDTFIRSDKTQVIDWPESESGQALCMPLGAKLDVATLKLEVGGGGANTAVAFQRLGLNVGLLARVGDDLAGQHIRQVMDGEGVVVDQLQIDGSHPTGQSIILLAENGNRTVLAYRGAGADFQPEDVDEEWLQQATWIYLSSIGGNPSVLTKIFGLCHLHRINVAWNPGALELTHGLAVLGPLLQQTDLLLLNREEAAGLTGLAHHSVEDVLNKLITWVGKGMVVVTNGAEGASAYDGSQIVTMPGNKTRVVDATGAGDSFGSGFLAAHILGKSMDEAMSFATANAASVISKIGAQPGLLHRQDLDQLDVVAGISHHPAQHS